MVMDSSGTWRLAGAVCVCVCVCVCVQYTCVQYMVSSGEPERLTATTASFIGEQTQSCCC